MGLNPHIPEVFATPFTAPFADISGEVAFSIGLIEQGGFFLVEIPLVTAGDYQVCFRRATTLGAVTVGDVLLENVTVQPGDLALVSDGNLVPPLSSGDTLYRPAFRVYKEGASPGTNCVQDTGNLDLKFETAIELN